MRIAAAQLQNRVFRPYYASANACSERIFAFDLDGTITARELLPRIARLAGLETALRALTRRTLRGDIPFELSFRRRFDMLRHIPLTQVHAVVDAIPLDP
jgi:phosphoserine phosphatase